MLHAEVWRPTVIRAPLNAISRRSPDPFERLFLEEYPKVVAIAYRVLADRPAAEDVAQEVFLKFHRSFSPDSERASGWLHAAAVHSALNVIRGERRRARRETTHALDPSQPP
ncbi:MAG TPA: sigma factor, partial [Candidatus Dormibacteraeota bacterium]|nr:sigma factor [Candidatus Dormibacteraeota bacterium]